jgi:hypothetical protein
MPAELLFTEPLRPVRGRQRRRRVPATLRYCRSLADRAPRGPCSERSYSISKLLRTLLGTRVAFVIVHVGAIAMALVVVIVFVRSPSGTSSRSSSRLVSRSSSP